LVDWRKAFLSKLYYLKQLTLKILAGSRLFVLFRVWLSATSKPNKIYHNTSLIFLPPDGGKKVLGLNALQENGKSLFMLETLIGCYWFVYSFKKDTPFSII